MSYVAPVPQTRRPRTAYDVWAEVYRLIEEEPLRYFQEWWVVDENLTRDGLSHHRNSTRPPCGTAACRFGWFAIAVMGRSIPTERFMSLTRTITCYFNQGVPSRTLDQLSEATACSWTEGLFHHGECQPVKQGDPEYVARGLRGLRTFMNENEEVLRAQNVPYPDEAEFPEYFRVLLDE